MNIERKTSMLKHIYIQQLFGLWSNKKESSQEDNNIDSARFWFVLNDSWIKMNLLFLKKTRMFCNTVTYLHVKGSLFC